MQTPPVGLKLLAAVAASVLVFGIFQACSTMGGAGKNGGSAVAISFTVNEPVVATAEQKARFIAAFNKYTDPQTTIVKDARAGVIWPPAGTMIKTDRVITPDPSQVQPLGNLMLIRSTQWLKMAGFIRSPQNTQAAMMAEHTYLPTKQFKGSVKSTQLLGFKSEADMQAFLRAVSPK
ncbi:MAG: hypothetical protein M3032_01150 [Verrucomicrobiota bacterium]|nr:hypothetical protein [Verrucomicrobiota bacterium]